MPNPILDALLQTLATSPHPFAPIANTVQHAQSVIPNIGLEKISIGNGKNKAQAQTPVQPPIQPPIQLPVQPTQTTTIPPQAQGQGFDWGELLRAVGVPLAATIAGVASPNMLAGAAGLSQGYAGGYQKQKELDYEKAKENKQVPLYLIDGETGEVIDSGKKISKDSMVRTFGNKQDLSIAELFTSLKGGEINTSKDVATVTKPENVPQADWDKATDQQRADFLKKLNGR